MANAWIVGVLGLWMILTPFLGFGPLGYAWNDWAVGVITTLVGFSLPVGGQRWVAVVFGIWLFISGFIGGLLATPGVWWNNIIVGVLFAIAGFAALPHPPHRPVAQH